MRFKFARYVATVGVLSILVLPGQQASAISVDLGVLTPPSGAPIGAIHFGSGSVFSDTFSFSVTADASLKSLLASISFSNIVGISNFVSSLWQVNGTVPLANGVTTTSGNGNWGMTFSSLSFSPLLASGAHPSYEVRTGGTVIGWGGSYGGIVVLAPVAAIPEPEIYVMMLAGLGLMGFMARRRMRAGAAV